jgi:tRNA pseudouridine38-40 synthase
MTRWKLIVEYDGRPFVGWQRQDNGPSVQQALEEAVQRLTGEAVRIHGAGRTDAGVHALGQVAHVDIAKELTDRSVRDGLNFHLRPNPVAILSAEPVADDFHARLSAIGRGYVYRIVNRRAPLTLDAGRAWLVWRHLDAEKMHEAARSWSAITISPASAPACVRPARRSKRSICWRFSATEWKSASLPARGPSCTIRSATWSERWS